MFLQLQKNSSYKQNIQTHYNNITKNHTSIHVKELHDIKKNQQEKPTLPIINHVLYEFNKSRSIDPIIKSNNIDIPITTEKHIPTIILKDASTNTLPEYYINVSPEIDISKCIVNDHINMEDIYFKDDNFEYIEDENIDTLIYGIQTEKVEYIIDDYINMADVYYFEEENLEYNPLNFSLRHYISNK